MTYDREPYPDDLTDAQWALVEPHIPKAKAGGHPRTTDVREVFNALSGTNSISHLRSDQDGGGSGLPALAVLKPCSSTSSQEYGYTATPGMSAVKADMLCNLARQRMSEDMPRAAPVK